MHLATGEGGFGSNSCGDPATESSHFVFTCRQCPGKHFAQAILFTLISSVLHTYWISAPTDENGKLVPVDIKMTLGVISYVLLHGSTLRVVSQTHRYAEPFDCDIKPRSAAAETLIRALMDEQKSAGDVGLEV